MNSLLASQERTCSNPKCVDEHGNRRSISMYNRHLFCWQCLRNPKFANVKKTHCQQNHNLLEVGKTGNGSCKECEKARRSKVEKEPRYHLANLQRIKNESGETWREVWKGIGEPKEVSHCHLVNYSTYRNGKPNARCPKSIAVLLAEHLEVTLENLMGEEKE